MKKDLLITVIGMFITFGAMAQNVLQNGEFEEQGEWKVADNCDPIYDFGSFENIPSDGNNACLYLNGTSSTLWSAVFVYQKVTLTVGKSYEFSGAIKSGANSTGGNPDGLYWAQMVLMPVGNWDLEDKGDPDWANWGVDNSILFDIGKPDGDVDGLFETLGDHNYMGSFLGEAYDMGEEYWSSGDTVHFTVPQMYVKDPVDDPATVHTFEDLGAAGTDVEFYFIIYCGASPNGTFDYSVDGLSIKEYTTTAVLDLTNDANNLSVYPNPVEGILNVKSATEIHSISVINIVGQEVLKANISSDKIARINTLDLNSGVYLVRVVDAYGEISLKKVIKK